jgi:hypothetical protein
MGMIRIVNDKGPTCRCCGGYHGRALRKGEHCFYCTKHKRK